MSYNGHILNIHTSNANLGQSSEYKQTIKRLACLKIRTDSTISYIISTGNSHSSASLSKNKHHRKKSKQFFTFVYLICVSPQMEHNQTVQQYMNNQNIKFYRDEHIQYVLALDNSKDLYSIGKYLTEHLKVAGGYWSLTSLAAFEHVLDEERTEKIISWLKACQNEDGGFGGNIGHDSHMTSTHYAVLILLVFGRINEINTEKVIQYVSGLQQPDGSFFGDKWGEVDTRFSYCGVSCLKLLNALDKVDKHKAAEYVLSCRNFDGSFGGIPDAESHGAYVFCCVGTLKITGYIDSFDQELLAKWLCERQTNKGGFNGRPEKLPDVCYSWWIYSAFCMMEKEDWIDQQALQNFILQCQDEEGGISDRPGNTVDVFHTFFGLAALSLLRPAKYGLTSIDPTYAIPKKVLAKMNHMNL